MGYDIHMVVEPTDIPSNLKLQNPDSPGYHRFNIRAMPITLGAMDWADCIGYEEAQDFPPFPFTDIERGQQVMAYAMEELMLEEGEVLEPFDFPSPTDEERKKALDYRASVEAHLCAPNTTGGPPAAYKYESNTGWLVTTDECLWVANAIDEHKETIAQQFFPDVGITADNGRVWLTEWSDFNRLASTHGGYRIY